MFIIRIAAYLWALPNTLIGLVVILLTLRFGTRARIVDGVIEAWGKPIALLFRSNPWLPGIRALTLGHTVLAIDEMAHDQTRSHERIHVRQYERWGPFFLPAYGLSSLVEWVRGRRPYRDNRFEREAYGDG